jgi:hypothetical protein
MVSRSSLFCATAALLIAPALAACSSAPGGASAASGPTVSVTASPSAAGTVSAQPKASASVVHPTTDAAPGVGPMEVRDAFAVLQATYNDNCSTPGNCEYFLDRLLRNLDDLDNAMKASPEGKGHFAKPLAWIAQMQTTLDGDFSFTSLKKQQSLLTGTREKINTWMQSHPEDYR